MILQGPGVRGITQGVSVPSGPSTPAPQLVHQVLEGPRKGRRFQHSGLDSRGLPWAVHEEDEIVQNLWLSLLLLFHTQSEAGHLKWWLFRGHSLKTVNAVDVWVTLSKVSWVAATSQPVSQMQRLKDEAEKPVAMLPQPGLSLLPPTASLIHDPVLGR